MISLLAAGVKEFLNQNHLSSKRIGIAFSGGADSLALLHLVKEAGISCAAYYYNHNLRTEQDCLAEEKWVMEHCRQFDIPLERGRAERNSISTWAKENNASLEEAARKYRYSFFEGFIGNDLDCLLLAHHREDWIENQIMRFCTGAGINGLTGIKASRPPYFRPLLNVSRDELRTYLEQKQLQWFEDSSNTEEIYLRNKVRHRLIPVLKEIFPELANSLQRGAAVYKEAAEALSELPEFIDEGFKKRMDRKTFWDLPVYLRKELVYNTFDREFSGSRMKLPGRFLKPLEEDWSQKNQVFILKGYGFSLYQQGNTLFWARNVVNTQKNGYLIRAQLEDWNPLLSDNIQFSLVEDSSSFFYSKGDDFFLRSPVLGDMIFIKGKNRPLKEIYDQNKSSLALVCDLDGIAAVIDTEQRVHQYRDPHEGDKKIYINWKEVD